MENKNRYEIIIYGRGGQGAKTTAELLAQALLKKGKYIQAFPQFGPERSGAPVSAFVKISDQPIRSHEPITNPDCVLVLDETMIEKISIMKNLSLSVPLIINSKKTRKELASSLSFNGNIIPVDASGLALEIIGENRPNSVILGKLALVTGLVGADDLADVFREKYLKKIGRDKVEQNIKAIQTAYKSND